MKNTKTKRTKTSARPKRPIRKDAALSEKEYANVVLASIREGVIITDRSGRIMRINPAAQKFTGFSRRRAESSFFSEVITLINVVTRKPMENPVKQVLRQKESVRFDQEAALINVSGQLFAIEAIASPLHDKQNRVVGMVFVFHDTTASHELNEKISFHEMHDPLTGLYNRFKFKERLEELIKDTQKNDRQHALCYCDLDKFKIINDTCGHLAGDQLLKQIANLFQGKVRQTDLTARLGGDEFGILLVDCPPKKANEIAGNLCKNVHELHFTWDGKPFTVGISIGVVVVNASNKNVDAILSDADGSCYLAKEKGGNRTHLHLDNDQELLDRQGEMQYISRITNAFDHNLFRLYCQPIVPLRECSQQASPTWYEILIRMMEEGGKIVAPMQFLPAAERYDMMPAIDRWVFSAFFSFFKNTLAGRPGTDAMIFDLNVSGVTLNDDSFLDFIKDLFSQHQVPPGTVCIEITETAAIANLKQAVRFVSELKLLGCKFSLDDFGSGVSSFKYLKYIPVDYLKIDGSFVKNIVNDPVDAAIVSTINQIGHLMGIQTVAEFVETKEISDKLRSINVDFAQGYFFSKPQPLEETVGRVSSNEKNGHGGLLP
jgi:diguanylate cyclase (GGDEF)-like protein/PAS domain S-box-containing protein